MENVDVVVIGMGPGGEDAATRLAKAGLTVIGVEARLVGGECPYFACVPTKMMIRAADALGEARRVEQLAGSARVRADWAPVAARIRDEATDDWDDTVAVERFEKTGGRLVRGRAAVTAPGEVTVSTSAGDRVFRAGRGIVLNPGTEPAIPPIDGLAATPYWTNREAVAVVHVPESLIVLGGGPVGCEFAQVFARFGAQVTVLEAASQLLPGDEPEAGRVARRNLRRRGNRRPRRGLGSTRGLRRTVSSPWRCRQVTCWARNGCWWRRVGAPIWLRWASARPGSTSTPARSTSTSGCVPQTGSGRSGTSPARVRSPTCRCTRRGSPPLTSSAGTARPLTTGRSPGSPSPIPRSAPWA